MQLHIPFHNPLKNERFIKISEAVLLIAFGLGIGIAATWLYFIKIHASQPQVGVEFTQSYIKGVINAQNAKGVDFSPFWDVWAAIQEKYVGRKNLDVQKMVNGAIEGLVNSLGDDYSVFFEPEQNQEFESEVSGKFEGIGIEIGLKNKILTVIAPLEGTPAKQAGLEPNDAILKINSTSTIGMSLDQAIRYIRGPKGSTVTLSILRDTWDNPRPIVITRDVIAVPSATIEKIGDDVIHLRLYNFYAPLTWEFRKRALEILLSGRKKIVLDVRGNPGGYLNGAIETAGYFLPSGSVAVKEDDGAGPYVCDVCKTSGLAIFKDYKIVVLIDGGSASASEIVAGALRDNRGVLLIGQTTFGKGSVQEVYPMANGSSLKLTIAKWLTPNGHSIAGVGLKPDIEIIPLASRTQDIQLDKAVEVVRSL